MRRFFNRKSNTFQDQQRELSLILRKLKIIEFSCQMTFFYFESHVKNVFQCFNYREKFSVYKLENEPWRWIWWSLFIAWGKFSSLHVNGKQGRQKSNKDNKSLKANNYSSFQFPGLKLISFLSLLKHQTQWEGNDERRTLWRTKVDVWKRLSPCYLTFKRRGEFKTRMNTG